MNIQGREPVPPGVWAWTIVSERGALMLSRMRFPLSKSRWILTNAQVNEPLDLAYLRVLMS